MLNIVTMFNMALEQKEKKQLQTEKTVQKPIQKGSILETFLAKKYRASKSFSTKTTYKSAINKFAEFISVHLGKTIDELLQAIIAKELDPINVLDDFYSFLSEYKRPKISKTGYPNTTIRTYLIIAKELLNNQGVKIYNEDVRQRIKLPKRDDVYEEGYTKAEINRAVRASNLKLATVILMKASSGMRIGETIQLKLSDINFDTNPTTIKIRKETTKTRQLRFTHISTEATNSLKDYLAKTFNWTEGTKQDRYIILQFHEERIAKHKKTLLDPKVKKIPKTNLKRIIGKLEHELKTLSEEELYNKAVHSARTNLTEMLEKTVRSIPELSKKLENDRDAFHFHGLRAWFKTQVTLEGQGDFAEALMGHKSLKLIYFRANHQAREKTYLKIEHALTIADTEKVEKTLAQQRDRVQELTELVRETRQQHKQDLRQIREEFLQVINSTKKV